MKNLYICKHENGHGYCLLNDEYCPQSPCKDEEIITYAPVKQEWISVRDRLPEEKVKVLVVLGSNIRGKRICIDQRISGNWRGLGRLVTHWMPLPEPPERDDE